VECLKDENAVQDCSEEAARAEAEAEAEAVIKVKVLRVACCVFVLPLRLHASELCFCAVRLQGVLDEARCTRGRRTAW
jgi:hypothetical protein